MKTVMIDRSLAEMRFHQSTKKTDVYYYAMALIEAGADYIEVGLNAMTRLPKPNGSENYIYRIETPEEVVVANAFPFAYAVIPLRLSYLIQHINVPVILEVKIGSVDPLALIKVVSDNIDLTKIAMLRLIGDFTLSPNDFAAMVKSFRARYAVALDICPTNETLMALSNSIIAYASEVDSITVSYGNSDNFTPFEEFLIAMSTMYRVTITPTYIPGICKAAVLSALIGIIETKNLQLLMQHYRLSAQQIKRADGINRSRGFGIDSEYEKSYASVTEKSITELVDDEEISEQIMEIMKVCNIDLFSDDKNGNGYLN